MTSPMAQMGKNLPVMQKTWVRSLGQEDPLEKGIATHFSMLAWRIPIDRSLAGHGPWGSKESDTTEWLFFSPVTLIICSIPSLTSTCIVGGWRKAAGLQGPGWNPEGPPWVQPSTLPSWCYKSCFLLYHGQLSAMMCIHNHLYVNHRRISACMFSS